MMAPRRFKRRKRKIVRKNHFWTLEDYRILSHLRYLHRWSTKKVQESHFPSLSLGALATAYSRTFSEAHIRQALLTTHHTQSMCVEYGPCYLYPSHYQPQATPSPLDPQVGPARLNHGDKNRYNLRPNRPVEFPQKKPRYLVDRSRFPHFSKSYKRHLGSHDSPDRDYTPPSCTPSLNSSDRSPSVISTQLSEASSLELFGLEPRSPESSQRESTQSQSSKTLSPEFISADERLPSP